MSVAARIENAALTAAAIAYAAVHYWGLLSSVAGALGF